MFDLSAYGQWLPNTPSKPLGTPKKQAGTRGTPQNKAGVPTAKTENNIKNNNLISLEHVEHLGTPKNKGCVPAKAPNKTLENNKLKNLEHVEHVEHLKTTMSEIHFLSNDELEAFEERAAIIEYEGGLTRNDAEQQALVICLADYRQKKIKPR